MNQAIAIAIVSILLICEGIFVLALPKKAKTVTIKIIKNETTLRTFGFIELLIGLALLLLAISSKTN